MTVPLGVESGQEIRVVVADDVLLVREGLRQVLQHVAGVELVAMCADRDSTLAAVDEHRPALVLTDIRMPPGNRDEGLAIAARLRETDPDVGVIVLSQYAEPAYALALFDHGAARRGYLLKDRITGRRQLIEAIGVVAAGGSYVDPKVIDVLLTAQAVEKDSRLASLTPREVEVLRDVAAGWNNASIAERLNLNQRSVERHIGSIFAKLGLADSSDVSRRVAATLIFLAGIED